MREVQMGRPDHPAESIDHRGYVDDSSAIQEIKSEDPLFEEILRIE